MFALPEYPPYFWLTAVTAIVLLGIAKGGFGGSGGAIATPLMSLTIPVADAAALLLILLIIMDFTTIQHYRHYFDRQSVKYMLIGSVFGIILGALMFQLLNEYEGTMKAIVGVLSLLYVAYSLSNLPQMKIISGTPFFRRIGVFFGAIAGFASTLMHAGGPPAVMYLLPQKLPVATFAGTLAVFFTTVNLMKLVPYSMLGLIRVGNISTILVLAPLCLISARLGIYLNKRFDAIWFNRVIYFLLFLTGLQLIFRA